MRLAVLYSGGKDSTLALQEAACMGHDISCLLTVHPASAESHLLHHPGTPHVQLQAHSMNLPWRGMEAASTDAATEDAALDTLTEWAIAEYDIGGLVHGGVRSNFQRHRFAALCGRHDLVPVHPLWGRGPRYVRDAIRNGMRIVILGVSAGGLDGSWLGRTLTIPDMDILERLSGIHGFATDFEGGEAETFVADAECFSRPIMLCGTPAWDGYAGTFQIADARLGMR